MHVFLLIFSISALSANYEGQSRERTISVIFCKFLKMWKSQEERKMAWQRRNLRCNVTRAYFPMRQANLIFQQISFQKKNLKTQIEKCNFKKLFQRNNFKNTNAMWQELTPRWGKRTWFFNRYHFKKRISKAQIEKCNFKKTFSKIQMHCDKSLLPMRQDILIYFFFFKHTNAMWQDTRYQRPLEQENLFFFLFFSYFQKLSLFLRISANSTDRIRIFLVFRLVVFCHWVRDQTISNGAENSLFSKTWDETRLWKNFVFHRWIDLEQLYKGSHKKNCEKAVRLRGESWLFETEKPKVAPVIWRYWQAFKFWLVLLARLQL